MDRKTLAIIGIALLISVGFSEYRHRAVIKQIAADTTYIDTKLGKLEGAIGAPDRKSDVAIDAYLDIPVHRAEAIFAPRFVPRVRYTGNIFNPQASDTILMLRSLTPQDRAVIWSEGIPLKVGDEIDILDNEFHDLHAGTTFIKIRRISDSREGYIPIETFIGETVPIGVESLDGYPISISVDDRIILPQFAITPKSTATAADLIGTSILSEVLSAAISKGSIHPVTAANQLNVLLLGMPLAPDEATRDRGMAAAKRIFDEYIVPAKVEVAPGAIAWPNTYDFPVPWGALMKAPWYSAYSNGVIACAAALMFRYTHEAKYADIARQAVAWLGLQSSKGGALYRDGQFSFVAEYPSTSPRQPNIRILDGEMIAVISVYNAAILLQDSDMLQFAARLAYGLASQIEGFTTKDDRIQNGRYQWLVDNPSYVEPMKRWALQLGIITKDQRFLEVARRWKRSDVYWPG